MSGADKVRWRLAPGWKRFQEELLSLKVSFPSIGTTIYSARNILKRAVWQEESVIIKSFAKPNFIRRLVYSRLKASKAKKSFFNAFKLQDLQICTPSAIGFLEHFEGSGLRESFYVCEAWPSEHTVREPLNDQTYANRVLILKELGYFAWELHKKGIYHRDFSPGNILFKKSLNSMPESTHSFCLVDINRISFGHFSLSKRMKNFAMLWATDEDLKIIVSAYTQVSDDDPKESLKIALQHSRGHKWRSTKKEQLKTLLALH